MSGGRTGCQSSRPGLKGHSRLGFSVRAVRQVTGLRRPRGDRPKRPRRVAGGWRPSPLKGAKGAPVRVVGSPGEISVRQPQEAGAPLRCSLSPTVFPPRESPLPSVGLPPVAPPNDHHRVVAVLMNGYFAHDLSQPGPHWVAVALPGCCDRQTTSEWPLSPPGGDCGRPWRRWASGRRAWIAPRRPSAAQEIGNPRTRVARRTQFRSKDPS